MNIRHRLERAKKVVGELPPGPSRQRDYLISYVEEEMALVAKSLGNAGNTHEPTCPCPVNEKNEVECGRHSGPNGEWTVDFAGSRESLAEYCKRCMAEQRTRMHELRKDVERAQHRSGIEPLTVPAERTRRVITVQQPTAR